MPLPEFLQSVGDRGAPGQLHDRFGIVLKMLARDIFWGRNPLLTISSLRAAMHAELGISHEAVEIYLQSDVIDLHLDSFIWTRVLGYDLRKRHGGGLGARRCRRCRRSDPCR